MAKPPQRPAPEPLEANDVAVVTGGTVIWFVLFVVQLPFYGWLDDHGHLWMLWTCLAGGVLGLFGIWYVRRRRDAMRRADQERELARQESLREARERADGEPRPEGQDGTGEGEPEPEEKVRGHQPQG